MRSSSHTSSLWTLDVLHIGQGHARVSLQAHAQHAHSALQSFVPIRLDLIELARIKSELQALLSHVNLLGALDTSTIHEVRKLGLLLFDELLPPDIKHTLRTEHGHDLLLRIDESLADLPWELLHTGTSFLSLRWNLGRALQTQGQHTTHPPPTRSLTRKSSFTALIIADPCGDLDAAYEEGTRLYELLDGQLYLDVALQSSEVSRSDLKENLREFDFLHFAGHAEVDGHGDGWLMNDGRFTHDDLLRIQGGRPFPALVFANACGSGRTARNTHTPYTIARTFIESGVQHFLGTHWAVPDFIAHEFAFHFYRALTYGASVGYAVRQARTALSIKHGDGALLWASYCLFGDPSTAYFEDHTEPSQNHPDLPVVDILNADTSATPIPKPKHTAHIHHDLDLPVSPLLTHTPPPSQPHPSMRNDALALKAPSRISLPSPPRALTQTLLTVALSASAAATAVFAVQHFTPPASTTSPPTQTQPTPPQTNTFNRAAAAFAHDLEQEALEPPEITLQATALSSPSHRQPLRQHAVSNSSTLYHNDKLHISVRSNQNAYLVLLRVTSVHNTPELLLPHPLHSPESSNFIRENKTVILPSVDEWYTVPTSNTKRTEAVLVLASKQPIESLDALLEDIREELRTPVNTPEHPPTLRTETPSSSQRLDLLSHKLTGIQTILSRHNIPAARALSYQVLPRARR